MRGVYRLLRAVFPLALLLIGLARADDRVVVVANADPAYTHRKYGDGITVRETFVLMQGHRYRGSTDDPSFYQMSFRQVISYLLPKLAQQQFVPAASVDAADLLIAVHWGVTNPRVGQFEMTAQTHHTSIAYERATAQLGTLDEEDPRTPLLGAEDRYRELQRVNEFVTDERSDRTLAQLLGYSGALAQFERRHSPAPEEETLRRDLRSERYFIIVRAYDLRKPAKKPRPCWTLHLNISSPGNNFRTAMMRMSDIAPQFMGRSLDRIETVRSKTPEFKVELGDPIILGEVE